jgi:hypothetical protein
MTDTNDLPAGASEARAADPSDHRSLTAHRFDLREQLENDRATGTFGEVQLPLVRITRVHGVLWDLDPKLLRPGNGIFEPDTDPRIFFDNIRNVLNRHPLARRAEVRVSGTGLHLIVGLDPPLDLHTASEQRHWEGAVMAVQRTLPVDPRQPGITAVSRVGTHPHPAPPIPCPSARVRISGHPGRLLRRLTFFLRAYWSMSPSAKTEWHTHRCRDSIF